MNRRLSRFLRTVFVAMLVAVPVFAKPPHAPDEQYDSFDRDTVIIIDKQTDLRWDRNIPIQPASFDTARNYCQLTFGGRLPTVKELLTLFDEEPHDDYEGAAIVSKQIDPDAFGKKTPVDVPYWSNSPATQSPTGAMWTLDFRLGGMAPTGRSELQHYRCVK